MRNLLSLLALRFDEGERCGSDTITTFMMKKLWIIYGLFFFDWNSREQKSCGRMEIKICAATNIETLFAVHLTIQWKIREMEWGNIENLLLFYGDWGIGDVAC